jgi:parallel beta-helix repeat protein
VDAGGSVLRRFCVAASALILIFCAIRLEVRITIAGSQIIRVPQDYATVQAAVDAASPGDTICISSGTYCENVYVGKPLSLVGESRSTTIIDANRTGFAAVWVNASNVAIRDLTITQGNPWALCMGPLGDESNAWLKNISKCLVTHNTIIGNMKAFFCHNSTFTHNSMSYYSYMLMQDSSDNIIACNYISAPGTMGTGIWLLSDWREQGFVSDRNIIAFNNITNCGYDGIELDSCSGNIVVGNNITDNGWAPDSMGDGLLLIDSYTDLTNTIYHNNFANNTKRNAAVFFRRSQHVWDNGYPSGGNYYDNYTGVDQYSGPLQNLPGSDGVGDTPYVIPYHIDLGDKDNVDRYPLMAPCSLSGLCVLVLGQLKTIVGEGLNLSTLLYVVNWNPYAEEDVQAAITVNGSAECSQLFTVNKSSTQVFTLAWNTTGFEKGAYRVLFSATATWAGTRVQYEGEVFLTIAGDVDANRLVDIFDVVTLTAAYEARRGEPGYTLNKDLNSDNIIDILDVVACTSHYEETW